MNLFMINESGNSTTYGIGTYIRELTALLADSDMNICVVYLNSDHLENETEKINSIRHLHIPSPVVYNTTLNQNRQNELYYRNVLYILQLHIIDTENSVFQINSFLNSTLVDIIKKKFQCKIITMVHYTNWGFSVYDNLQRLRNILHKNHLESFDHGVKMKFDEEKALYAKSDYIVCFSNYMFEILCQDYQLDPPKISIIPNGLSDTQLQKKKKDKICENHFNPRHLRTQWNISPQEKIILFAGRIDEIKGVRHLIKAFRETLKKFQNCRLMIAGSGNYNMCFQEAKEICTKITFTGLLEKGELYELYQIADIGVVPSLFEPFGYVAVEMMMYELPVVVTATSGLNEVVDVSCGLKVPMVVRSDSVEIDAIFLSEKILYLLQHPAEAKKMGQNGRKRYLKEYHSDVFRKNMLQLYESALIKKIEKR